MTEFQEFLIGTAIGFGIGLVVMTIQDYRNAGIKRPQDKPVEAKAVEQKKRPKSTISGDQLAKAFFELLRTEGPTKAIQTERLKLCPDTWRGIDLTWTWKHMYTTEYTLLMWASYYDNLEAVKVLLYLGGSQLLRQP